MTANKRDKVDILVLGTGTFAGRIIMDLAATGDAPLKVLIAGRNRHRATWFETAANARGAVFERPISFASRIVDLMDQSNLEALLAETAPTVVVQAATVNVRPVGGAWRRLADSGGLSTTAIFQALLSARVGRAMRDVGAGGHHINACFPDVVNQMLAALKLPITCGVGNVSILANAFRGAAKISASRLKVLAQFQHLAPWRQPPETREAMPPRVWIDDREIDDVIDRFRSVWLSAEPAVEISGSSGVPLMIAMATGRPWIGHAPGALGLPGGYPVVFRDGKLALNLPENISVDEAVAWNAGFETRNGLAVDRDGNVRFTGALQEGLAAHDANLAKGFHLEDLEAVYLDMKQLKEKLEAQP